MFVPALALTVDHAKSALEAGLRAIGQGQLEIDLGQLTTVDSAGVATLLAWQRAALLHKQSLGFRNVPANLSSLIELYGVADLLRIVDR